MSEKTFVEIQKELGYAKWEQSNFFSEAFNIALKKGSCVVNGDSFLLKFKPYSIHIDPKINYLIYHSSLFSLMPISGNPDYCQFGEHILVYENKVGIRARYERIVELLK